MQTRSSLYGILCLCAGLAVFSVQDLILKLLSGEYPLHQAMVFRSLTALPLLLALVHFSGGLKTLVTPGWTRMVWRGWVMFLAYTSYYLALAALPMASTAALFFSAPLFITLLSVLMLKERVSPLRWLAVALGFAGVLVMLRPGAAMFDWALMLPVVAGLTYGLSMISARSLGQTETAAALAFWGNAVFLLVALLLGGVLGTGRFANEGHASLGFMLRGWVMPDLGDALLMCGCGGIAAAGLVLLTQAYRTAKASVIAPFEYTALIWSVIYGWTFWQAWPDAQAWAGIAIIVGAGLFVLWRERVERVVAV